MSYRPGQRVRVEAREHQGHHRTPTYLELEHGAAGVRLMRAIKHALDPDDIFNPGKIASAAVLADESPDG